eukprot:94469-Rhodomonas_salina.2
MIIPTNVFCPMSSTAGHGTDTGGAWAMTLVELKGIKHSPGPGQGMNCTPTQDIYADYSSSPLELSLSGTGKGSLNLVCCHIDCFCHYPHVGVLHWWKSSRCPVSADEQIRQTFEQVLTVRKCEGLQDTLQGKLKQLSIKIQDFRNKIWNIENKQEDTPFCARNLLGPQRARRSLLQHNAPKKDWLRPTDKEALARLVAKIGPSVCDEKAESKTHTVSSRLRPVNQTDSKTGSACGSAHGSTGTAPASLTTPVKKSKLVGSEKRRHIEKAKAERARIGTPGSPMTERCVELKARADAKADADAQVLSSTETLTSLPGTPDSWEWGDIFTEDYLCEE